MSSVFWADDSLSAAHVMKKNWVVLLIGWAIFLRKKGSWSLNQIVWNTPRTPRDLLNVPGTGCALMQ